MNSFLIANAIACAAAIWFAAHHSMEARKSAIALTIGWLFYISAWLPDGYNPRDIIYIGTGEKIASPQLWAMMDCVVSLYIAYIAFPKWWSLVLWLSFTIQINFHILRLLEVFDFQTYSSILDNIFVLQIAVFLVLGWPNVRNLIVDIISHYRRSTSFATKGRKFARRRP